MDGHDERRVVFGASGGAKPVDADNRPASGKVHGRTTEDLPSVAPTRKGRLRARLAGAPCSSPPAVTWLGKWRRFRRGLWRPG